MTKEKNSVLLTLDKVSVHGGAKVIVEDVSFTISAGEIITLIGPNGAGKTTLIKTVLGFMTPASGHIQRREGLKIGYMPQRIHLAETVPLNVQRFLQLARGVKPDDIPATLDLVGASHLAKHAMQTLSGGELQRVLLARALLRRPHLLVLDEPVQGVDIKGQSALYQLISDIRTQLGCAVLMVSHDLHFVMASTDTVICMNHHVCCHGHPEQVSADPAYLQLFGLEAADNLALYAHHHDHSHGDSGDILPSHSHEISQEREGEWTHG